MAKYDDASWHSGGDFPDDLPDEAAATHIGMFVAWAVLAGLGGEDHDRPALENRSMTPGQYVLHHLDEKFTDSDLNDEGNAFAAHYYDPEQGKYMNDYVEALDQNLPSVYHVADTWENFEILRPYIDRRFQKWRQPAPPSFADKLKGLFGKK